MEGPPRRVMAGRNVLGDHGCIKKTQKRQAHGPVPRQRPPGCSLPSSPPLPSSRRRKSKKVFTEKKLFTQLVHFDQKITLTKGLGSLRRPLSRQQKAPSR